AIWAAVSMPIVLCSMSMNAKSKPQAARIRPVSTVRACRSPMPTASWPAFNRSRTLLAIESISSLGALACGGRGLQLVDVLCPVPGEQLEALAAAHDLAVRPLEARLVEGGRAAGRRGQAAGGPRAPG